MNNCMGIDIGGTKINFGVVDEKGCILRSISLDTKAQISRDAILEQLLTGIYKLGLDDIKSIGIGTPGFIDTKKGFIKFAGNLKGWSRFNLKEWLSIRIPAKPIFVGNDANMAALCESWIGAGKNFESFVMVTLGTGVGGAYYRRDIGLLEGEHFQGLEIGHMILYPAGKPCTCGQKGCAEQYCSGTAIERNYGSLSGNSLSGEKIFEICDEDKNALETISQFQFNLGTLTASLRNVFDPDGIIIGGGVIHSKDRWWDGFIDQYRQISQKHEEVSIVAANYLNDAGVIGAARMAYLL